jgi:phosphoribosylanthranilate isomerase
VYFALVQAAQSGADLVGIILWPRSKRSVTDPERARAIANAAREGGAEPVGVFVDESTEEVRNKKRS